MRSENGPSPALPWHITHLVLIAVCVLTIVLPIGPRAIIERGRKMACIPFSFAISKGSSIRLIEQKEIPSSCYSSSVAWSRDGTTLVVDCGTSLEAWSQDGLLINTAKFKDEPLKPGIQLLTRPLRVAYSGDVFQDGRYKNVLTLWDVSSGNKSILHSTVGMTRFSINQDHDRVAVVFGANDDIKVVSLADEHLLQTFHTEGRHRISCMRWLQSGNDLLMGTADGMLLKANVSTGDMQKLASPYFAEFVRGGETRGYVEGLARSPDAGAVATYQGVSMVGLSSRAGYLDRAAYSAWITSAGSGVEIRSSDDGRLISRMPGNDQFLASDIVWDPKDRFIALAGRDALILWAYHNQTVTKMPFGGMSNVRRMSINPAGTLLAISDGGQIRIFQISQAN